MPSANLTTGCGSMAKQKSSPKAKPTAAKAASKVKPATPKPAAARSGPKAKPAAARSRPKAAGRKARPATAKTAATSASRKAKTWSLTGLSIKTKTAVERAAAESGQPVRAWADAALRAAATQGSAAHHSKLDEIHAAIKSLSSRLDDLSARQLTESVAEHFDSLSDQVSQAAGRLRTKAAPAVEEMFGRMETAIDELWAKSGPVAREFRDRVESAAEEFRAKTTEAFDQFRGKASGEPEPQEPAAPTDERKSP